MVHPDHRRQGLFTRMTETAIEKYSAGEPAFFFNFPNHQSGPGYLKLGWETVGEETTYYRIQNPNALGLDESTAWKSVAAPPPAPCSPATTGCRTCGPGPRGRDRAAPRIGPDRDDGGPGSQRVDERHPRLAGRAVLRLALRHPAWDYSAYVAERGDEPVAGMVVGTSVESGLRTTKVTDVVPTPDGEATDEQDALLHRLIRDYADSDVLAAPSALSRSALGRAGSGATTGRQLGSVANPTTHVVRSLTGDWTHNGVEITDPSNWRLTFSEQDTSSGRYVGAIAVGSQSRRAPIRPRPRRVHRRRFASGFLEVPAHRLHRPLLASSSLLLVDFLAAGRDLAPAAGEVPSGATQSL